jgi:hypothetical protein
LYLKNYFVDKNRSCCYPLLTSQKLKKRKKIEKEDPKYKRIYMKKA